MEDVSNSNKISQLLAKTNDLEQYFIRVRRNTRNTSKEDVNTNDIVKKVGNLMNVEIQDEDISISHRLPTRKGSNSSPAIIVKFTRRVIRDEFYEAKKAFKSKTTKHLGLGRL